MCFLYLQTVCFVKDLVLEIIDKEWNTEFIKLPRNLTLQVINTCFDKKNFTFRRQFCVQLELISIYNFS